MKTKHIPLRTCVACRETSAKRQLVRVVRAADGTVTIDPTGKANGRGAYLCTRRSCWSQGLRSGALARALKVEISEADRAALAARGEQYEDDPKT